MQRGVGGGGARVGGQGMCAGNGMQPHNVAPLPPPCPPPPLPHTCAPCVTAEEVQEVLLVGGMTQPPHPLTPVPPASCPAPPPAPLRPRRDCQGDPGGAAGGRHDPHAQGV